MPDLHPSERPGTQQPSGPVSGALKALTGVGVGACLFWLPAERALPEDSYGLQEYGIRIVSDLLERRVMSSAETTTRPPRNSHGPILPTRLAHALSAIAQTLPNPWDESTDYFIPFSAEIDGSKPANADTLRRALDIGGHFHLDLASVDLTATGANSGDDTVAKGFALLDVVMKATLSDITRVTARAPGVTRVRTWVLGRFAKDWLVGLRTESTET
jgi:hypothetical protein